MDLTITAVCVLVINPKGQVLQVARRGTTDQWGIVGGKVEPPDKSPAHAAAREVREESGVIVKVHHLIPLFTSMADEEFVCQTFLALEYDDTDMVTETEEGPVQWGSYSNVIEGPFGEYNRRLLEKFSMVKAVLGRLAY